jgi:hypothetical protein
MDHAGRAKTESLGLRGDTIGVRMHGVTLNLRCDYPRLLEHTAALLEGFVGPAWSDPDIEVNGSWRAGTQSDTPFFDASGLDGFGKRMLMGHDRLVWPDTYRDKDLQLRFARRGPALQFDVAYHFRPSARKLARYPDLEAKKFFDLLRYLVHFPIAWHLERGRGWTLLHASAVAEDGRAVLIAGPGGSGKTTTSVALTARPGLTLVSENLLLTDGCHVWPLCEPIRLTDESLALLGAEAAGLESHGAAARLKEKSMYRLAPALAETAFMPEAIFVPQFSGSGFLRPIPPGVASETLRAINRLTLELCDYDWYSAALDLLWPAPGQGQRTLEVLRELTECTPCWALGIDRSAGVGPVVDRILGCWRNGVREG